MELHVEITGNKRDTCRILVSLHEGKGPIVIPRRRREGNIRKESPRSTMGRGMDCCGLKWRQEAGFREGNILTFNWRASATVKCCETLSQLLSVLRRPPCIACTDRWTESSNFSAAVSECAYFLASRPVFGDIN